MADVELVPDGKSRPQVRLACWGDFALTDCATGASLRPRGRKARALLAYLALHPGKPVSRERLTGLLWGDRAEEQARASLRQAIQELKPLANGCIDALKIERDRLLVGPAALRTDLEEPQRAFARRDYPALLAALPEPGDVLFGDLDDIDDGFDDWLRIERTRQREAMIALLAEAAAAAVVDGEPGAARAISARLREFDPAASAPAAAEPTSRQIQPLTGAEPAAPPPSFIETARWRVAALLALFLLGGLAAITAWQWPEPAPAAAATIAVLPFKNLSGADGAFAEGLSEEITTQLARESGLRVAGRTSSALFKDRTAGLEEVGRRLGVRYVVEGSVRSAGGRVRVNVALAQASDGVQLWAESFDGTAGDVLAIQQRIGTSVAGVLGRKLARARPSRALTTSGEVYRLYLNARVLIRERNYASGQQARRALARAVQVDPGFAPAWASLAQATRMEANQPGPRGERARARAEAQARRALSLAPDLAEAHGVLGMILGFDDPRGQRHVKRAAALDPGNAEFQYWLGHVHLGEMNYPAALAAYERALEIDPLWRYAQEAVATTALELGRPELAGAVVRRVERTSSRYDARMMRAMVAAARGDFSSATMEANAAAAATDDPAKKQSTAFQRGHYLFSLGLFDEARREWNTRWGLADDDTNTPKLMDEYELYFAIRRGKLPSLLELRGHSRSLFHKDQAHAALGAKMLINAGRAREVVALYDGEDGFLGVSRSRPFDPTSRDIVPATIVAAALRDVGRADEAGGLLARCEEVLQVGLRRSGGRVLTSFLFSAASVRAMRGDADGALSALETARRRGWTYVEPDEDDISLPDIGDEPAFRALRGRPRFERLRAELKEHLARERREIVSQLVQRSRSNRQSAVASTI